jgi:hypothetical protein
MTSKSQLFWLETASGECIPIRGHISLGRSRSNTVPINCERSSRRHALIRETADGGCVVLDLGSSNGTFLNGCRVAHSARVQPGDSVEIGAERFVLRALTPGADSKPNLGLPIAEPEQIYCWIITGDQECASPGEPEGGTGDDYKTVVGWVQMCRRILENHQATVATCDDRKLFAWLQDPHRDDSRAVTMAKALAELKLFQSRRRNEFRLAVHAAIVVVGSHGPQHQGTLVGTEVSFALHMQRLAWILASPCLLSEEANRRLSRYLKSEALEPCGLDSYKGNHRFFTY